MESFDVKSMFESGPINLPSLRDILREKKRAKDEDAYDQQARKLAKCRGLTTQEEKNRWMRAYRKMKENKDELKDQGSIHYKSKEEAIFVLKFRKEKGDKRVQSAIHLGSAKITALAAMVLHAWRVGRPLRYKGEDEYILKEAPISEKFAPE